jgi:hypothetical protein
MLKSLKRILIAVCALVVALALAVVYASLGILFAPMLASIFSIITSIIGISLFFELDYITIAVIFMYIFAIAGFLGGIAAGFRVYCEWDKRT